MEENFWNGFFTAINCEYSNVDEIQGASGLKHKVLCVGVDDSKKRLVIVQDDQDARILSMTQADIQAKIKGFNVLMVRPVPINLKTAFIALGSLFGSSQLTDTDFQMFSNSDGQSNELIEENKEKIESLVNTVSPQIEIIQKAKLSIVPIIKEVVQQLSHLKFINDAQEQKHFTMDFGQLLDSNPVVYDSTLGICPIPLYDFTVDEAETFIKNKDSKHCKFLLEKHSIYQFFYPPADSLALGFIENEKYNKNELSLKLKKVPDYGHPFGKNELIDESIISNMIEALKDKGLIVEGEFSTIQITEEGSEKRMQVKFKPRESIFKRLSNVFSVKIDLNIKDLFK